MINNH